MNIRPTQSADTAALQTVLDQTELFPSDMLPDMLAASKDTSDIWLTALHNDTPIGFCFAKEEALAEGTWNMLAIAVSPECQGSGCGAMITAHLETMLKAQNGRILLADTSGTDDFAQTRAFYAKNGFTKEARIRDYWGKGDDKITFLKSLT